MPRRHDDLFGGIASFAALRSAARRAIKGKRKKPGAAAFMANFEREILNLDHELRNEIYKPGRYVEILVRDPKERLVSAAPFRDRVVHHALCAVICPLFEPGLIDNTFANRTGKGTHAAIRAYEQYRTLPPQHRHHVITRGGGLDELRHGLQAAEARVVLLHQGRGLARQIGAELLYGDNALAVGVGLAVEAGNDGVGEEAVVERAQLQGLRRRRHGREGGDVVLLPDGQRY